MHVPSEAAQSRAAFLRSLGLSATVLSAIYFGIACSKPAVSPAPDPTDGTNSEALAVGATDPFAGKIDFTLDLTKPDNAKLKTVGQFVSAGLIVVAHVKDGSYVAMLSVCTHASGSLWYRVSQNDFRCQDHGGLFTTDGSVKLAPPKQAVKIYSTTLSTDGNSLRVVG